MFLPEVKLSIEVGLFYMIVVDDSKTLNRQLRYIFNQLATYSSRSHHQNAHPLHPFHILLTYYKRKPFVLIPALHKYIIENKVSGS